MKNTPNRFKKDEQKNNEKSRNEEFTSPGENQNELLQDTLTSEMTLENSIALPQAPIPKKMKAIDNSHLNGFEKNNNFCKSYILIEMIEESETFFSEKHRF